MNFVLDGLTSALYIFLLEISNTDDQIVSKFNCLSYDYVINIDGDGNIGGCQQYIPPGPSFGNIFNEKDPFNSLEMDRLRDLMRSNSYAHDLCRFCFKNWEL